MAYFDTKSGSLEEAIRQAVGGQKIEEKVEYVEYKFKSERDARAAKKMLDAVQLMDFDINDDDISNGELVVSGGMDGDEDFTKYHKEILKKFRQVKVLVQEKMDAVNKTAVKKKFDDRKDKDIDNDGDVDSSDKFLHKRRKAISKAVSKDEGNKFGKELKAARDKGEKTFVVSGKTYNVEDYQKEELDDKDKESVKDVVKGLKKAVKTHQGQVASLTKDIKDEVDVKEGKMKELAMKIASVYTKMKKDKQMKPFADKFRADVKTSMNIRKSLEKVLPDYVGGGDITKLMSENFIGTPETTKARLDATPGQSSDDWNEQVGIMQKKNTSMREALAKVWGFEEGHNPFKKEMHDMTAKGKKKPSKKEGKTMTGKPETKVVIDPDMKEKVK